MLNPVLLRRVLANLIMNGVQAMPNGGRHTITASKTQDSTAIGVQDTGVGVAEDNLGKIFNPFFTTNPKGKD
jgi:two-component system sensor histidine kinase AtoS